jgi:uncharacterized protein
MNDTSREPRTARWATWLAGAITHHPRLILAGGLLLAVAAIVFTALRLEFQASRNDLIDDDIPWNQRFIDWWDNFPGTYDLIVVVDTHAGAGSEAVGDETAGDETAGDRRRRAEAYVDALAAALAASEHVRQVEWGAPASAFSPRAARLMPLEPFHALLDEALGAQPLLAAATPADALTALNQQMAAEAMRGPGLDDDDAAAAGLAGQIADLAGLIDALGHTVEAPDAEPSPLTRLARGEDAWEYLVSPNGRLMFLRVTPRIRDGQLDALAEPIAAVRSIMAEAGERFPDVDAGLTGVEVVESDETQAATIDSAVASAVACVLIALLLIAAFHTWRMPLLTVASLLVGIAWSFGYLTLVVGHLQILSVVFVVILLGLGVAYGIHLMSTFERVRHEHADKLHDFRDAMARTFSLIGPGVATGAITTSAAFAVTALTEFRGVAEMGLIAAGGVLLCFLATFTMLPALLRLFSRRQRHVIALEGRLVHLFEERWVSPFIRHPRWTLAIAAVLTGLALGAASQMRFSNDLMALQPRGLDSVQWQQRIADDGEVSIWFGISITDSIEEARQRRDALLDRPTVGAVRGIGLLFPDDDALKRQRIEAVRAQLAPALEAARHGAADTADALAAMRQLGEQAGAMRVALGMAARRGDLPPTIAAALRQVGASLHRLTDALAGIARQPADQQAAAAAGLQRAWDGFRAATARQLTALLDPSPLEPADLPEGLLRPYIDASDPQRPRYALEIHSRLPDDGSVDNPLSPYFLPHFVSDIRAVDPHVTGVITQIHDSGHMIRRAYQWAGVLALGVVFVLVWIGMRDARDALLCLMPVAVGFALTFGLMWLAGIDINPANIIVLPLMFGIGVDSGVHMLHRYRQDPAAVPPGLTRGTGKGITVTSFTTMIGFAAMMLARHRGIASLGFVLTVGLGLTLLACWTVVPAWLRLRQLKQQRRN